MITFDDITIKYEKNTIINNLSYAFETGKITAIIGESGIGKTSLLNLIAGLITSDSGSVSNRFERTSYVFQEPRLFPWLTALENVSEVSNVEIAKRYLALMKLENDLDKYPQELSGGMKQRVSIARALAYAPDLVLMDEPFKGLDSELRREIRELVFEELRGKTVIMVTHDESDTEYADIILKLTPTAEDKLIRIK